MSRDGRGERYKWTALLSIGLFFSIMVVGLSSSLPASLSHGLTAGGLSPSAAARVAGLPLVSVLFAAFLGARLEPRDDHRGGRVTSTHDFTFLIGRDGTVLKRHEPPVAPADIKADQENYL